MPLSTQFLERRDYTYLVYIRAAVIKRNIITQKRPQKMVSASPRFRCCMNFA